MKNYERYKVQPNSPKLERVLSSILWRSPSDRKIIPLINQVHQKRVLDVGCGRGEYAEIFLRADNDVIGIDKNPERCTLGIVVINADAAEYTSAFTPSDEKFDIIFSAWLTEYLNEGSLKGFILSAQKMLKQGGSFIFTVINKKGWGNFYVGLAKKIRKIDKYAYKNEDVMEFLSAAGFNDIKLTPLNSWMGIPWANLYTCRIKV